jgi:hypothetical protein
MITQYIEIMPMLQDITTAMNNPTYENLKIFFHLEPNQTLNPEVARQSLMQFRTDYLNAHVTVGASGAVFGILLAFGMLFPNIRLDACCFRPFLSKPNILLLFMA